MAVTVTRLNKLKFGVKARSALIGPRVGTQRNAQGCALLRYFSDPNLDNGT